MEGPVGCDPANPFCGPSTQVPEVTECGSRPIEPTAAGVNIMLAIDGSKGMERHWPKVSAAIRSLRASNPSAAFGIHRFWSDAVELGSEEIEETRNSTNNACLEIHQEMLELGDHSADDMVEFLADGPRGGVIADTYQVATIVEPLSTYLTGESALVDPSRTNYLVVFTHGNDNCFGSAFVGTRAKLLAYKKIAVGLARRGIRVVPVGLDAPMMDQPTQQDLFAELASLFDLGLIGNDYMQTPTDYGVLQTLLEHGGSGLAEVPRVDTMERLEALTTSLGGTFRTCRFALPSDFDSSESVNPFEVTFTINGMSVPRDRFRANGWDFVSATSEVEFFGESCQAIQAGRTLQTHRSCGERVCGNAAVQASTKPRAVLLLLDSSQSRTACSDGSLDCVLGGFNDPDTPPTYWEVVHQAVSEVLVEPVNDEVMFGLQFFPFKNSAEFSCEVAEAPEIPPAPGQQIAIMKAMLEKHPNGLSPMTAVMESVADNPGILIDPAAIGAVVLLTEGGDNCTGAQEEIIARLGQAASQLLDQGVPTYAIRYGSMEGQTPEQTAQLSVVAESGGTAAMNQDVPFIDATSPEEFLLALNEVSHQLATCAFELGDLDERADKDLTNLFLDGKQVGFDATGAKLDGWGWADDSRSAIELYGEACTAFKSQRHTNISVEFGCEIVVLI